MIIKSRGAEPVVDASAFIAPTAVLSGNVSVGPRARVMYGAVLSSEASKVELGECAVICENVVLRATAEGDTDLAILIGDHVFVGPHATLLGCRLEPACYIAAGATVLQGARVGKGAAVGVGALVHANSVVPDEFFVPPNAIAVGDPVEIYAPGGEGLEEAIKSADFARTAFGVHSDWEDRKSRYRESTEVRSKEFGAHFEDVVIDGAVRESNSDQRETKED